MRLEAQNEEVARPQSLALMRKRISEAVTEDLARIAELKTREEDPQIMEQAKQGQRRIVIMQ